MAAESEPLPSRRQPRAWIAAAAGSLFLLLLTALASADVDREQAESELLELSRQIGQLKGQLESARADHRAEQQRLREVDLATQRANLEFRKLESRRQDHLVQLKSLERQREEYLSSLEDRRAHLAEQVRAAYRMGNQSRMKLLLNQDDPALLGRMLAYYDYLNRAQVEKISGLREALDTLDRLQQPIDEELQRVVQVQNEQADVLEELAEQRENRATLLAQLAGQIDSDANRLQELERNRKDLEVLIERLSDALADIPADLGSEAGIRQQKGQLRMPVTGPVRNAFGQKRGGALIWQGWLIGVETGTEVNAIARGRVAFADWLRGYGLLLIIDHGQGYLSLYAHNESLLREVGDWVESGAVVSIVGSNPGTGQGLYFELRRNGAAVDPAGWLAR